MTSVRAEDKTNSLSTEHKTMNISFESLMECVAVELPGRLAPIEARDMDLYKSRFAREGRQFAYSHAWSYIIQACRNFMYRYVSDNLLISLGFHRGRFVFISILGLNEQTLEEFRHFTHLMYEVHPEPIYIKKVFPDQLRFFDNENWGNSMSYPWDEEAHADEDTYPEMIANLSLALDYQMPWEDWKLLYQEAIGREIDYEHLQLVKRRRKDFRNELAVFERMNFTPTIEAYNESKNEEVLDFLREYFRNNPDNIYAYHNLLDPELIMKDTVQIARVNEKVVGLWILEDLGFECYGLYAAVFSRVPELSGISEALYRQIFQQLIAKGAKYLALGGCELERLYRFKLKFAPQEEREMKMVAYDATKWWYNK